MAPNPRVTKAFKAMRNLGISEDKVKPVLKNLLKLYDKNWELIEEENYRALADAIFDQEEAQAVEKRKKHDIIDQAVMDEEAQVDEEPERPLKRLRLRHQEGHVSPSSGNSMPDTGVTTSRQPKREEAEPRETCQPSLDTMESSHHSKEHAGSYPSSPQPLTRNKGKQPVYPKPLSIQERIESHSVSPPRCLMEKGKEPLSLQVASRDKKAVSGRSTHAVKEPMVQPGIVLLPKKAHNSLSLIKPKDEPFTEDMPQFEVPLAVIHPEPLSIENPSSNGLIGECSSHEYLVSPSRHGEDRNGCLPASSSQRRTNCELANIVDKSSSQLEITSSPAGEVKISLACNSALGRPNFHIPSVDAVVKMVEDRCLRSYKVLDPSFSVMKIMKDMCECFLELGSDSVNDSQQMIDVTPAVDLLKQFNGLDSLVARGKPFVPPTASVNTQGVVEAALSGIPKLLSSSNGMYDCAQTDKTIENTCEINNRKEENRIDHANSQSLVVVQQCQPTLAEVRLLHDVNDIAKGEERVLVSLVNEFDHERLKPFLYIPQNVVFQNAYTNFSLARIGESCCSKCFGDCLSSSTPCGCANETAGSFAYSLEGLVKEDFLEGCILMSRDPQKKCMFSCKECPLERIKKDDIPEACKGHKSRKFIKECWWKCGCNKQCGNRVVQRGINCNLQIFMTPEGKGWGLRTLQDLPKGAFVCEYVGEILTNAELYERVSKSPSSEGHDYLVPLDADWGSGGVLKDEEALCLDATYFGNVARFINHRCSDSNLVEIPVEVETPDHRYYRLAFFTTRKVEALEELTWDYGIDFDDHDHLVKVFECRCGSEFCRNIKCSSRS